MGKTYQCARCAELRNKEDFKSFDENMETGICYYCEPPVRPSHTRISRVNSNLGTEEQKEAIKKEIALYEKYAPKSKPKPKPKNDQISVIPEEETQETQKTQEQRLDEIFKITKKQKPKSISYKDLKSIVWRAYRQIVYNEVGILMEKSNFEKEQIPVFKNVLMWIARDKDSELDLNRNLIIYGNVGIGKTTLMKAIINTTKFINQNQKKYVPFKLFEMDIETANMTIERSLDRLRPVISPQFYVIDDIDEPHAKYKHFGNEINLIQMIVAARHIYWKAQRTRTIMTTNLPVERLIEALPSKTASRMMQEYTFLEMTGKNKR